MLLCPLPIDLPSFLSSCFVINISRCFYLFLRAKRSAHLSLLCFITLIIYPPNERVDVERRELTFSDPTSDLVRQHDFPFPLRCRKTSETVSVAFVRPLSEPVRRFSSCSTECIQQIAQVVVFLFLHVFLF
jgi:hypothetical protein